MEAFFFLIKNFVWILIGMWLVRGPLRAFARATPDQPLSPGSKAWAILRLVAGIYCIAVSFYSLISTVVVLSRSH